MDLSISGSDVLFIKSIEKHFCSSNVISFNLSKKYIYKYRQTPFLLIWCVFFLGEYSDVYLNKESK